MSMIFDHLKVQEKEEEHYDTYWSNAGDDLPATSPIPAPVKDPNVKQCKYCNRDIIWEKRPNGWFALDKINRDKHSDYCMPNGPQYEVKDRIIAFWKNATIVYDVTGVDKTTMKYIITQPKNSNKRYAGKAFPMKMLERVATKLDKISSVLYT